MTLDQAIDVLAQARTHWLHAYVTLSLLTGIRTEEARALQWSHVVAWVQDAHRWQPVTQAGFDRDKLAVYVWRSVRAARPFQDRFGGLNHDSWRVLRCDHERRAGRGKVTKLR